MDEEELIDPESRVELTAGLISALFEFSRAIDKKLHSIEFQSRINSHSFNLSNNASDILITCSSEIFLNKEAIKQKIKFIYKTVIEPKIPLITASKLLTPEQELIWSILTDDEARNYFKDREEEFTKVAYELLEKKNKLGLEMICLYSFDFSIVKIFGKIYSLEEITNIMRHLQIIVNIPPFGYEIMHIRKKDKDLSIYFANSGVGVTVNNSNEQLFEPYYYSFIGNSNKELGEAVEDMIKQLNDILKE